MPALAVPRLQGRAPALEPALPGTNTGTGAAPPPCTSQGRELGVLPQNTCLLHLQLFKHSAHGFLFSPSSVTHQQSKPDPWDTA